MRFLLVSALCLMVMPVVAQEAPSVFNKCLACHAIGEDAVNKVGPRLNGVVGRPLGSLDDYNYSQAMLAARDSGVEWNRQTLTRFLKLPKHFLPGTSMAFAGMTDRAEIDTLIDYLASFDANGTHITP
ncbi:cytochrome c family protein [Devosia ginsengisoli]|uniref:c-type cytochrome n=1 Tax=Devosia ginsengisoli TaxID=400770 RepID=UPI0026EC5BEE|nr:cytochrome c family protein [Devosia ginsengisoli]MCR6673807.1 cytochrome c family protein [Devosia ginsengisoli]